MKVYGFVRQPNGNNKGPDALLLRVLNGRPSVNDLKLLLPCGKNDTPDPLSSVASVLCNKVLGMLVDKWIDSGKTASGDEPYKRKYPSHEILEDYLARNPPLLRFTSEGPSFLFEPHNFRDWKELGPLAKDFLDALLSELQDARSAHARDWRRIMPFAWDMAIALFLQLLDSPIAARLFHCDGCGAYFTRTRSPKKDMPIYRGSWCADCKSKGGIRRTEESRKNRKDEMVNWAADAWAQWTEMQRHKYGKRVEYVAQQVNKRLKSNRNRIAKNWVTHHQTEIEAEVERRSHATRKN